MCTKISAFALHCYFELKNNLGTIHVKSMIVSKSRIVRKWIIYQLMEVSNVINERNN